MKKNYVTSLCWLSFLTAFPTYSTASTIVKRDEEACGEQGVAVPWNYENEVGHAPEGEVWTNDINEGDEDANAEQYIGWEGDSINHWFDGEEPQQFSFGEDEEEQEPFSGTLAEPWEEDEHESVPFEDVVDYDDDVTQDWEVDQDEDNTHCTDDSHSHGENSYIEEEGEAEEENQQPNIPLPADVNSQEYLDALREIGVQNVAAGAKGITYSFYTSAGSCKAPEDIQRDISKIQHFEIIRVYDTDCDGVANILKTMGSNQKIYAGIHYPEVVENSVEILNNAINNYGNGDWNKIHTVSVGNEMVNFGRATPSDLKASINKAKGLLSAKGYTGPVVTTDTLVAVLNNRELCTISDYLAVNSHPYWDGGVPAVNSGPWLQSQLSMLNDVCGLDGKPIFLAETGWPHTGRQFGEHGIPSKDQQLLAIKSIVDTLGPNTILFTTFNDYWKDGGSHDVEKYWGIYED